MYSCVIFRSLTLHDLKNIIGLVILRFRDVNNESCFCQLYYIKMDCIRFSGCYPIGPNGTSGFRYIASFFGTMAICRGWYAVGIHAHFIITPAQNLRCSSESKKYYAITGGLCAKRGEIIALALSSFKICLQQLQLVASKIYTIFM